jgi:predicted aspartyl protease
MSAKKRADYEKNRQRKLAREKKSKKLQAKETKPESKVAFRFKYHRGFLANIGPLIPAEISVPEELISVYQSSGIQVPTPESGHLLIDTGASVTLVQPELIDRLGLKPIDETKLHGVGGACDAFVYYVLMKLKGKEGSLEFNIRVVAHDIDNELFRKIKDTYPVIGLLGRDFLLSMKFVCDFPNNEIIFMKP